MAEKAQSSGGKVPHCPYCDNELPAFPFCSACQVTVTYCETCGKPIPKGKKDCPTCGPKAKKKS